ncbi:hypothetical protein ACSBR1_026810 [Camellia fascicularis]
MSSNAAESFNSWIREAQNLPITRMVDSIRGQIMRQMAKRRANNDVYEVHSYPSVMVDIGRRTCSCFQWQINEFRCAHVIVTVRKSRRNLDDIVVP